MMHISRHSAPTLLTILLAVTASPTRAHAKEVDCTTPHIALMETEVGRGCSVRVAIPTGEIAWSGTASFVITAGADPTPLAFTSYKLESFVSVHHAQAADCSAMVDREVVYQRYLLTPAALWPDQAQLSLRYGDQDLGTVTLRPDNVACDDHLVDPADYETTCASCTEVGADPGPDASDLDRMGDVPGQDALGDGAAASDVASVSEPASPQASSGCAGGTAPASTVAAIVVGIVAGQRLRRGSPRGSGQQSRPTAG